MVDLFLSYSRADGTAMRAIVRNLRTLGFNVWVDIDGLTPGTTEWEQSIDAALNQVDAVIVLLSPDAKESVWVNNEIRTALLLKKPIFPVLLAGDEITSIPISVRSIIYTDMRDSAEQGNFRLLVQGLADRLGYHPPDYTIEPARSGHIPRVSVIGGDTHIEGRMVVLDEAPSRRPYVGLAIGVIALTLIVAGLMVFGRGGGEVEPTPSGVAAQAALTTEPTPTATDEPPPTVTPTPTLTPTITPTLTPTREPTLVLAESGEVASNADWTPYLRTFDGVDMALVPAGCYQRGSTANETTQEDEQPVHTVCFDSPFWVDVYEVTNAQYGSVGVFSGDERPRDSATWAEADAHCKGRNMRLPTEAEWEYVARGPDSLLFPWGNDFDGDNLVWAGNAGSQTRAVGFRPNDVSWVGVFDLAGNVQEWTADWYDEGYYAVVPDPVIDPPGPFTGQWRVVRGGSWASGFPFTVRNALRIGTQPEQVAYYIGFRCAQDYQP